MSSFINKFVVFNDHAISNIPWDNTNPFSILKTKTDIEKPFKIIKEDSNGNITGIQSSYGDTLYAAQGGALSCYWAIFLNSEKHEYLTVVQEPQQSKEANDWGVFTFVKGKSSSEHFKGNLTKDAAIEFAKSQRRHGSDEVKVVIMKTFAEVKLQYDIKEA